MSIESLEHMMRNRVRMFLRHSWLVAIFGTAVVVAVVSASIYYFTRATEMRIATGPDGSANAKFAQVLAKTLAQDRAGIALQPVATSGADASVQAMANGKADLAILPSTVGNSVDWPVIAILRQNVMVFIVPAAAPSATASASTADSSSTTAAPTTAASPSTTTTAAPSKTAKSAKPVKTAKNAKSAKSAKSTTSSASDTGTKTAKADASDDSDSGDKGDKSDKGDTLDKVTQLAGKRIGIVTGNEASTDLLDIVLNHYGVSPSSVQVSMIDPKNLADAVHANQIDAIFVAGSATGQAINDAVAAAAQNGNAPSFIEINQADGIAKRSPAFAKVDIDAGTFGGNPPAPDDSITSLSFAEYLVVNKSFNHNAIATLARQIYTSRHALGLAMGGDIKIEAPSTDKDGAVTVAPGAMAYLTDNQQGFFDKYGNEIFYGMLIFPVIGSGIAGVASYLSNNSRTRRLRLLQRVLDLVRKAHAAQTVEAIEHLQIEADNLVIAIVHLSEHEEFDETVRMSFSFALDQLRFAIAARRTAILDHVGGDKKAAAA